MNFKHLSTLLVSTIWVLSSYAQIANDVCRNATLISASTDITCQATPGSFARANQETAPDSCKDQRSPAAFDQWFRFEAVLDTHVVDVETFPGDGGGFEQTGAVVEVWDACQGMVLNCGNPELTSFGPFTIVQAGITRVQVNNLSIGSEYFVRIYNYGDTLPPADQSDFTICVHAAFSPPPNDSCASATLIVSKDSCEAIFGTVNGASQSQAPQACGEDAASESALDVWFKFKPASANQIIGVFPLNDTATSLAPVIEVWESCTGPVLECSNPDIFPFFGAIPGPNSLNINGLDTNVQYWIRVYHYGAEAPDDGDFGICVFNAPPPPPNDSCSNSIELLVGDTCVPRQATLASATQDLDPLLCDTTSESAFDVWFHFEAEGSEQIIEVTNTGDFFNGVAAVIELYNTCNGALIDCAEPMILEGIGAIPGTTTLEASGLDSGSTYTFRVYHFGEEIPNTPDFEVCVYNPPPPPENDDCENAVSINQATTRSACNPTQGSTIGATASNNSSTCAAENMDDDVWYSFTAVSNRAVAIVQNKSLEIADVSMGFALYEGSCNGNEISCASETEADSILFTGLTPGNDYFLRVFTGAVGIEGDFGLCVYAPPSGPPNDDCEGATQLTATTDETCNAINASFAGAFEEYGPDSCDENISANAFDTWFKFTALSTEHVVDVETPPTGGFQGVGAVAIVYDACAGNIVGCGNPNIINIGGFEIVQSGLTRVELGNLSLGSEYFVRVYNYGDSLPQAGQDQFTICVRGAVVAPPNDACEDAEELSVEDSCVPTSGVLDGATEESGSLPCGQNPASPSAVDVWYSFTAEQAETVIEVAPTSPGAGSMAPVIEVFEECNGAFVDCANPQIIQGQFGVPGRTTLNLSGLNPGTEYVFRTYHFGESAPSNGNFEVCVYNDPTVGIKQLQKSNFSIYPNPANDLIHIEFHFDGAKDLSIWDLNGKQILRRSLKSVRHAQINISDLEAGLYFVEVRSKLGNIQQKLIVK
ncbi:MAG: T9SS type A sorting domain-containing protein [Luteibaculum sp.]